MNELVFVVVQIKRYENIYIELINLSNSRINVKIESVN